MTSHIKKFTQRSFLVGFRLRNRVPYLQQKREEKSKTVVTKIINE